MLFSRPHPNHLYHPPTHAYIASATTYFPGVDLYLLWEYWRFVDEGGSVDADEVALAIQYPVVYNLIKHISEISTKSQAIEYVSLGVDAEAEGICGLKGIDDCSQWEAQQIASTTLLHALSRSPALPDIHFNFDRGSQSVYAGGSGLDYGF